MRSGEDFLNGRNNVFACCIRLLLLSEKVRQTQALCVTYLMVSAGRPGVTAELGASG